MTTTTKWYEMFEDFNLEHEQTEKEFFGICWMQPDCDMEELRNKFEYLDDLDCDAMEEIINFNPDEWDEYTDYVEYKRQLIGGNNWLTDLRQAHVLSLLDKDLQSWTAYDKDLYRLFTSYVGNKYEDYELSESDMILLSRKYLDIKAPRA